MNADAELRNRRTQREQRKKLGIRLPKRFALSASICVNLPAPLAHFIVLFHSAIPDSVATLPLWEPAMAKIPTTDCRIARMKAANPRKGVETVRTCSVGAVRR
jgi:hypothetical protein